MPKRSTQRRTIPVFDVERPSRVLGVPDVRDRGRQREQSERSFQSGAATYIVRQYPEVSDVCPNGDVADAKFTAVTSGGCGKGGAVRGGGSPLSQQQLV